jgi:hypothetical protein
MQVTMSLAWEWKGKMQSNSCQENIDAIHNTDLDWDISIQHLGIVYI